MARVARPRVVLVTPYLAPSNTGNWRTAARWARFLRDDYRVVITDRWDGAPADALIALHARRSAPSIAAFAAAHPDRPLIVVLTGTDLYRDIDVDADARRSLALAHRLVVLNTGGRARLPARWRPKAVVIPQSAPALAPARRAMRHFDVAVVGHLREEKNPQLVWRMLDALPGELPIRIRHAGGALDPTLGRRAQAVARRDPRYEWLGDITHARARQLMRRSHVLLHPSHMEGGAQAVIEAVMAGTPVIGSAIDGNTGLLGRRHPGLFAADDARAAAALVARAATDARFLARLARACARRRRLFEPAHERRLLLRLVRGLFAGRKGSTR